MTNGIVIDSSVLIDYFKGNINDKTDKADLIIIRKSVVMLPIILQEILQGIKSDKDFKSVQKVLSALPFAQLDSVEISINAASLYRTLRKKGITIRKPNDCLIAAVCIEHNFALLHNDKDFDNIAKHTSLKII